MVGFRIPNHLGSNQLTRELSAHRCVSLSACRVSCQVFCALLNDIDGAFEAFDQHSKGRINVMEVGGTTWRDSRWW